jgi:TolB-like protein
MASILEGYNYDIFISYRQKDNKYDGWVTEFVDNLNKELESTFKEEISVYFDINPHDGLLETHDVKESLKEKLKCLIFIPIISRTYCDPNSFAWEHEFVEYVKNASEDELGLKVKLANGNVASRVLPVFIHDLDEADRNKCESVLGSVIRGVEFIYKEPGVNKPLTGDDDEKKNVKGTKYRIQINKIANAIKELLEGIAKTSSGLSSEGIENRLSEHKQPVEDHRKGIEQSANTIKPASAAPFKWRSRKSLVAGIFFIAIVLSILTAVLSRKSKQDYNEASIAVLPLQDFSENHDKEYLADGITESITEALARNKNLRVISRGSAMRYRGTDKLYSDIAKELGVNLLLEGSVMNVEGKTRIVVQLIDPLPEERHLLAKSYTEEQGNVLGMVQKIPGLIAEEIFSTIHINAKIPDRPEVDNRAYELYLKGLHIWRTQNINKDDLLTAIEYLKQAIQIEPEFAQAYITMAEAYISINTLIGDNEEIMRNRENASIAIDKALQMDYSIADACTTKGNLIGKLNWDWEGMKVLADRGLELEPSNVAVHLTLSNYYTIKGNYDKAIDEALTAEKLDPLNPRVACYVAESYYIANQFDRAIGKLQEVIDLNPNYGFAYNNIGFAYVKAGYIDKAIDEWQKLQLISGNQALYDCYDEHPYQYCLQFYLDNATKNEPRFCSNPVRISQVQMLVGDEQGALDYLKIALEYKNEDLPVMITYPDFYPLRDNPEYQDIVRKIGVILPES